MEKNTKAYLEVQGAENQEVKIETLKNGELFKIGKPIYVRDEYNRSTKKYLAIQYENISRWKEFKKGTKVNTNID